MIKIVEAKTKKELKKFVDIPFYLYKNDPYWVAPLKDEQLKKLMGVNNPLFDQGDHAFFIAYKDEEIAGRILVGIEEKLNKDKHKKEGYISLVECIDSTEVFQALTDKCEEWLKARNIESYVGPISPTKGDDSRGILVEGFDGPPVLMNSYNPDHYKKMFEECGFEKYRDLLAFYIDIENVRVNRLKKVVDYAQKRYGYYIENMNLNDIDGLADEIKTIIDLSLPESDHRVAPSKHDIIAEVESLKKYADEDLLFIAKTNDGKPIGMVVSLPNYNEVLIKMKGKKLPFGVFKYLWYKKRVKGLRVFIQHVIPEYRDRAVNGAIFYKMFIKSLEKGYTYGEGSTIGEENKKSIMSVVKIGGKRYRTYRMYKKTI